MSTLLGAWGTAALVCVGLGLVLDRSQDRSLDADRLLLSFWLGLSLLLIGLQLWNLLLPVTGATACGAAVLGIAGLVSQRGRLVPILIRACQHPAWLAFFALFALGLANAAMREVQHYDTGLYLLGSMEWAREYAALPGIANLHERFAFNNAHLLYGALFESVWPGRAPNLVGGSLLLGLVAPALLCARRVARGSARASDVFALVMVAPVWILAGIYLVSLSSDLPATALSMLVAWRTFRILEGESAGRESTELVAITLLCAAATSVKLSALVFSGGCWLVAVIACLGRDAKPWRRAALATGLLAVALAPTLIRGVVVSGYPLYPSATLSVPVEWRVPQAQVERLADGILAWARAPRVPRELVLEGPYWLDSWARRNLRITLRPSLPLPLLLGFFGVAAAAVAGWLGRPRAAPGLWLLAPASVALLIWFGLAPAPRFAMFVFWSVAAAGIAAGSAAWGRRGARFAAGASVLLLAATTPRELVPPGPEAGFYPLPSVATRVYETTSGLVLQVPVEGDQCWGAPQPCTPYPRRDLRLREPGQLASGFTLQTSRPADPAHLANAG